MSGFRSFWLKITTMFVGRRVGIDSFGNIYYLSRSKQNLRWVIYNGIDEATKIPPVWRTWLSYTKKDIPTMGELRIHRWQKHHLPNLTGTIHAYDPTVFRAKKCEDSSLDYDQSCNSYQEWAPEE